MAAGPPNAHPKVCVARSAADPATITAGVSHLMGPSLMRDEFRAS
jgi:hypothetical protein